MHSGVSSKSASIPLKNQELPTIPPHLYHAARHIFLRTAARTSAPSGLYKGRLLQYLAQNNKKQPAFFHREISQSHSKDEFAKV